MVGNEIVSDFDVLSIFAARHLTVPCKQHHTLIVLVDYVVNYLKALPLKE